MHDDLNADAIKALVEAVKPGLLASGSLENVAGRWRLRVTFKGYYSEFVCRAVTIHDDETVAWVRKRI